MWTFLAMNQLLNGVEALPEATRVKLASTYAALEGMLSFNEALLLYCLAKQVCAGCIVEVGSYRGLSSVFLGLGSIDGDRVPVYAVDPHREFVGVLGGRFGSDDRVAFYSAMHSARCGHTVALINLSSEQFCYRWKDSVSLLWIDGDHRYESVKRDFNCWNMHMETGGVIAFHDGIDERLGPYRLISELFQSKCFKKIMVVENIVVLRKVAEYSTVDSK